MRAAAKVMYYHQPPLLGHSQRPQVEQSPESLGIPVGRGREGRSESWMINMSEYKSIRHNSAQEGQIREIQDRKRKKPFEGVSTGA